MNAPGFVAQCQFAPMIPGDDQLFALGEDEAVEVVGIRAIRVYGLVSMDYIHGSGFNLQSSGQGFGVLVKTLPPGRIV